MEKAGLTLASRFFFALFSAPAVGMTFGLLLSMGVTGIDGANGYAGLYYGVFGIGIAFFALLLITNKQVQIVIASLRQLVGL